MSAASVNIFESLKTSSRDYVINHDKQQIPLESLKKEGHYLALYFSAHWCPPCKRFTPMLAEVYNTLKQQNKPLEIVFVSSDRSEAQFDEYFKTMPWLALPFNDRQTKEELGDQFQVSGIPTLLVFDDQGKLVSDDARDIVASFGAQGYPFTASRLAELQEQKQEELKKLNVQDVLRTSERDYLLHQKEHVPLSQLTGKVVGLYFSAHWCGPCRVTTPIFAKVHEELKQQDRAFEIVFVSSDSDQHSFDEYYKTMPWLALPYAERDLARKLGERFDVDGIPTLILFDENGKFITNEGRAALSQHGAKGFPFNKQRLEELAEEETHRMAALPDQVVDSRHAHPLSKRAKVYGGSYGCDICGKGGSGYVYHCDECNYDVHPDCVKSN